jgi:hypothetical protein
MFCHSSGEIKELNTIRVGSSDHHYKNCSEEEKFPLKMNIFIYFIGLKWSMGIVRKSQKRILNRIPSFPSQSYMEKNSFLPTNSLIYQHIIV